MRNADCHASNNIVDDVPSNFAQACLIGLIDYITWWQGKCLNHVGSVHLAN